MVGEGREKALDKHAGLVHGGLGLGTLIGLGFSVYGGVGSMVYANARSLGLWLVGRGLGQHTNSLDDRARESKCFWEKGP